MLNFKYTGTESYEETLPHLVFSKIVVHNTEFTDLTIFKYLVHWH